MVLADCREEVTNLEASENVGSFIESAFFGGEDVNLGLPIHSAFLHHFQAKGGSSRGKLTQATASLLGQSRSDGCFLAAAVECLHNASLVQDDMQDKTVMRRGQRSVASVFGDHVALGLTDRLITSAFVCLSRVSKPFKLPIMICRTSHAVSKTVDGQTRELCGRWDEVSLPARLVAAGQKSGPLFALALELPLILAELEHYVDTAHEAACKFGLGYQILDDLKDKAQDAKAQSPGNLVLAMGAHRSGPAADESAVQLAEQILLDAATESRRLPCKAGLPLIELVEKLLPQLDAFRP